MKEMCVQIASFWLSAIDSIAPDQSGDLLFVILAAIILAACAGLSIRPKFSK
jgi:hypothetical protein